MRLGRLLVRQWRKRPGRAAAVVTSVALAVGAIVATWAATSASRAGYRRLTEVVGGPARIDVMARDGGRFAPVGLGWMADVPGVRAVVSLVSRPTLLRCGGRRVRDVAVGVDVDRLVAGGLLQLAAGVPCSGGNELVLAAGAAESLDAHVGDELLLFAGLRIRRMTVTGIVTDDSLRRIAEVGGVVMDLPALAALTPRADAVDRVRLLVAADAARAGVLRELGRRLPDGLVARVPATMAEMAEDVMRAAYLGLDFVTVLTAVMAWFMVGNAMLMNVTERRHGLSLLRLIGCTGPMIRRLVGCEAAVLGALGAIIGAIGGLVAARPISTGISRALDVPAAMLAGDGRRVMAAVVAGVLGTVVAAWWPAREAAAGDVLEGLSGAPRPRARGTTRRALVFAAVCVVAAAVVLALVSTSRLPPRAAVAATLLLLVAFVTATAAVLEPLVVGLGTLVPRRWHTEKSLALGQITRRPVRTALTAGVLVVAVSNAIGLGHAIRDNVDDIRGWFERALRADWLLTEAGGVAAATGGGRGTAEAIQAVPGVERVERVGVAGGSIAGAACVVVARDMPDDEPLPFVPVSRVEADVRGALAAGEAVAGTLLARRTGIKPGDEVVVDVLGRSTRVRVAALVVDYTSGGGSIVLRSDAAARLLGLDAASMFLVRASPGGAEALRGPLAELARGHGLVLRSFVDQRHRVNGMIDGVVGSLWAILALGFVVGSLGVANTVTMDVVEQTRTLGLLRAVGMTRGQLAITIVLQSMLTGAAGGAVGLCGGLVTAAFIQAASQPLLGHPLHFALRPGIVGGAILAALTVSGLAAWLPARRAARLDVLDAITIE